MLWKVSILCHDDPWSLQPLGSLLNQAARNVVRKSKGVAKIIRCSLLLFLNMIPLERSSAQS